MLSAEIDDKRKELLRAQKIAENISEQLHKDEHTLSRVKGRQAIMDKDLGVSHVLLNDISKLRSRRRFYFYMSTFVIFLILVLVFLFKINRSE